MATWRSHCTADDRPNDQWEFLGKHFLHWLDKTQSTGMYSIIIQDYVDTQTRPFFGSAASSGKVYKILEAGWRDLFHVNISYILKQWSLDFHYLFQWFPPRCLSIVCSHILCVSSHRHSHPSKSFLQSWNALYFYNGLKCQNLTLGSWLIINMYTEYS